LRGSRTAGAEAVARERVGGCVKPSVVTQMSSVSSGLTPDADTTL
jgi:hypothetical protein